MDFIELCFDRAVDGCELFRGDKAVDGEHQCRRDLIAALRSDQADFVHAVELQLRLDQVRVEVLSRAADDQIVFSAEYLIMTANAFCEIMGLEEIPIDDLALSVLDDVPRDGFALDFELSVLIDTVLHAVHRFADEAVVEDTRLCG